MLAVHLDGARIFNAAIATGADVRAITPCANTVCFCLCKGSGPVGGICADQLRRSGKPRRWRKMLGGGMRQAGVLAAAGLVALETMAGG